MKTKIKTQKPKEYEVSFRYVCKKCEASHWLFLRETQTKNFKIVCSCSNVIRPKRIKDISINYENKAEVLGQTKTQTPCENTPYPPVPKVPIDTMEQCVRILESYGYSRVESTDIVNKSYFSLLVDDVKTIIEYGLKTFGANYD